MSAKLICYWKYIFVMLIMQGTLEPPESVVDRVLINSFLICWYHHLSLQGTGYGSVGCQPLSKAHTVQRGRDEGPVATD